MSYSVGYATRQLSGYATIRKWHLQIPSYFGIPCCDAATTGKHGQWSKPF